MTWRGHDRPDRPDQLAGDLWRKSDQHRFEDRIERRLDQIEQAIDKLATRQAWIAGGLAVVTVVGGLAVRFLTGAP